MKKYKIGIFGSAVSNEEKVKGKARELGKTLSKYDVLLITGACAGLPYEVVSEAVKNGAKVEGFSPELNIDGQRNFTPTDDLTIYSKINYVPEAFKYSSIPDVCKKYRNVISTANCDAGIIISGRWGTMNEFTNLYDMGKVIGVLTDTGGIADELQELLKKITKKSKAVVIFDNSPKKLVKEVISKLNMQVHSGGVL